MNLNITEKYKSGIYKLQLIIAQFSSRTAHKVTASKCIALLGLSIMVGLVMELIYGWFYFFGLITLIVTSFFIFLVPIFFVSIGFGYYPIFFAPVKIKIAAILHGIIACYSFFLFFVLFSYHFFIINPIHLFYIFSSSFSTSINILDIEITTSNINFDTVLGMCLVFVMVIIMLFIKRPHSNFVGLNKINR